MNEVYLLRSSQWVDDHYEICCVAICATMEAAKRKAEDDLKIIRDRIKYWNTGIRLSPWEDDAYGGSMSISRVTGDNEYTVQEYIINKFVVEE